MLVYFLNTPQSWVGGLSNSLLSFKNVINVLVGAGVKVGKHLALKESMGKYTLKGKK